MNIRANFIVTVIGALLAGCGNDGGSATTSKSATISMSKTAATPQEIGKDETLVVEQGFSGFAKDKSNLRKIEFVGDFGRVQQPDGSIMHNGADVNIVNCPNIEWIVIPDNLLDVTFSGLSGNYKLLDFSRFNGTNDLSSIVKIKINHKSSESYACMAMGLRSERITIPAAVFAANRVAIEKLSAEYEKRCDLWQARRAFFLERFGLLFDKWVWWRANGSWMFSDKLNHYYQSGFFNSSESLASEFSYSRVSGLVSQNADGSAEIDVANLFFLDGYQVADVEVCRFATDKLREWEEKKDDLDFKFGKGFGKGPRCKLWLGLEVGVTKEWLRGYALSKRWSFLWSEHDDAKIYERDWKGGVCQLQSNAKAGFDFEENGSKFSMYKIEVYFDQYQKGEVPNAAFFAFPFYDCPAQFKSGVSNEVNLKAFDKHWVEQGLKLRKCNNSRVSKSIYMQSSYGALEVNCSKRDSERNHRRYLLNP